MKKIPLTCGMFALVDDEDYVRLSIYKWQAVDNHGSFYARRTVCKVNGKVTSSYMHREIMDAGPGEKIDHRNVNPLDNQRSNLRFATQRQNCQNRGIRRDSKLGLKGVVKLKTKSGPIYGAYIGENGRIRWIGKYSSSTEAARAYDAEAKRCYGEFANINGV